MRVFVTGGNGFIGSAVVRLLVQRGCAVVCLLRPTSRTDRIADLAVERVDGDVRDYDSVARGMDGCDATVHLAAPGAWGADDPATLRSVIEDGTRNVLDAAGPSGARRVLFVSSTAAVSCSEEPRVFDERSPFTVRDRSLHYAHAKHRAELLAARAHDRGVDVVTVNPAEVYGPGDVDLGTARNLIDFATSKPVLVCRGGTSIVHVDDVATGILRVLDQGRSGERYILGGDNVTIGDLARLVQELLGRRERIVMVPRGVARVVSRMATRLRIPLPYEPSVVPYATRYWFVDSGKARRELGLRFRSARETVGSTLAWLRAHELI